MDDKLEKMYSSDGFWSYVHKDDEADNGRITQLARDIVLQFEMLTADTINLFLDEDDIEWGENWRNRLDENLASVAFFIPVLTPRYFKSSECRRELQLFAREANRLGMQDLILPILYVDVPSLHEDEPDDSLVKLVKDYQWNDWRKLRFSESNSESYRKNVAKLAERLAKVNRDLERVNFDVIKESPQISSDEELGILDKLAKTEESLPKWNHTIKQITSEINNIAGIMKTATDDISRGNSQGGGYAARLYVAKKISNDLKEPVDNIQTYSEEFTTYIHDVDRGFRIIIDQAAQELEEGNGKNDNEKLKQEICRFFHTVKELALQTKTANESVGYMVSETKNLERLSRDMRPALRQLKTSLSKIIEANKVTNEWIQLINESKVDCQEIDI